MNTYFIIAGLLIFIIIGYLQRSKRAKNKVVCVIDGNCTGCQRCIKKCCRKALDVVHGQKKLYIEVKYPDICTACNDCVSVCKFNALELLIREIIICMF